MGTKSEERRKVIQETNEKKIAKTKAKKKGEKIEEKELKYVTLKFKDLEEGVAVYQEEVEGVRGRTRTYATQMDVKDFETVVREDLAEKMIADGTYDVAIKKEK